MGSNILIFFDKKENIEVLDKKTGTQRKQAEETKIFRPVGWESCRNESRVVNEERPKKTEKWIWGIWKEVLIWRVTWSGNNCY